MSIEKGIAATTDKTAVRVDLNRKPTLFSSLKIPSGSLNTDTAV